MHLFLSASLIILLNLFVAYLISLYSFILGVAWFCFAIGFRFGVWHGHNQKEEEFITREEIISDEYEIK